MVDSNANETYRIPDAFWKQLESLLPPERSPKRGGYPLMDNRKSVS